MKIKTNLIISLFLASLATFLIVKFMNKNKMSAPENPFFSSNFVDLDEKKFDPYQLKESVFVVSYFQTWCSDCVKEQPELLKLESHFKGQNFKVLMVSDEPIDLISKFKEKFQSQLSFYQLQDPIKSIGISRFPTTYLIDKNGVVQEVKVEGINWYTPEIIEKVSQLLK
jgi:thiol-disulfide isomerase/thioredoxin